jgi:hypothetical protein
MTRDWAIDLARLHLRRASDADGPIKKECIARRLSRQQSDEHKERSIRLD